MSGTTTVTHLGVSYDDAGGRTVSASVTQVTTTDCFRQKFAQALAADRAQCAPIAPRPTAAATSPGTTPVGTGVDRGHGDGGAGVAVTAGSRVHDTRASWLPTQSGRLGAPLSLPQLMDQLRAWFDQLNELATAHANAAGRGRGGGAPPSSAAVQGLAEATGGARGPRGGCAPTATTPAPSTPAPGTPAPSTTPASTAAPVAAPPATTVPTSTHPAPTPDEPAAATPAPVSSVTIARTATAVFGIEQQGTFATVAMLDRSALVIAQHERSTDAPIEVGARLEAGMNRIESLLRQLGSYMTSGKVPTRAELEAANSEADAIFEEATRLRTGDDDLGEFTSPGRDGVLQLGAIPPSTAALAIEATNAPAPGAPTAIEPPAAILDAVPPTNPTRQPPRIETETVPAAPVTTEAA